MRPSGYFYETRAEGIAKGLLDNLYALTPPVQPVAPAQNVNEAAPEVPPQEAVEDDAPQAPAQPLSRQILRKAQKR